MADYTYGTRVEWNWGNGTGEGKVKEKFTQEVTRTINGTDVTRKATAKNPAYLLEQDDGGEVLKSGSELKKVG